MQIVPVTNEKLENEWFAVERSIYKGDKNWIPYIRQEIEKIFDPKRNKLLRSPGGEAIRWVLKDNNGKIVDVDEEASVTCGRKPVGYVHIIILALFYYFWACNIYIILHCLI